MIFFHFQVLVLTGPAVVNLRKQKGPFCFVCWSHLLFDCLCFSLELTPSQEKEARCWMAEMKVSQSCVLPPPIPQHPNSVSDPIHTKRGSSGWIYGTLSYKLTGWHIFCWEGRKKRVAYSISVYVFAANLCALCVVYLQAVHPHSAGPSNPTRNRLYSLFTKAIRSCSKQILFPPYQRGWWCMKDSVVHIHRLVSATGLQTGLSSQSCIGYYRVSSLGGTAVICTRETTTQLPWKRRQN